MRISFLILLLMCFCTQSNVFAQKDITTFGIQYKPIVPNRLIGTYDQKFDSDPFYSTVQQTLGHSFGMVIRRGFTNTLSIETGINYTQRNFKVNYDVPDSGFSGNSTVGLVAYEIPIQGLVYIQLSDALFLNASFGFSLNYFASDVQVKEYIRLSENFQFEGARRSLFQVAALVNVGFEYRTKNMGYFYLGSSYNLPVSDFYTFAVSYEYQGGNDLSIDNIRGSYLTIDLRYFFHEEKETNAQRKQRKRKK